MAALVFNFSVCQNVKFSQRTIFPRPAAGVLYNQLTCKHVARTLSKQPTNKQSQQSFSSASYVGPMTSCTCVSLPLLCTACQLMATSLTGASGAHVTSRAGAGSDGAIAPASAHCMAGRVARERWSKTSPATHTAVLVRSVLRLLCVYGLAVP